jgi:hypothetical protein
MVDFRFATVPRPGAASRPRGDGDLSRKDIAVGLKLMAGVQVRIAEEQGFWDFWESGGVVSPRSIEIIRT